MTSVRSTVGASLGDRRRFEAKIVTSANINMHFRLFQLCLTFSQSACDLIACLRPVERKNVMRWCRVGTVDRGVKQADREDNCQVVAISIWSCHFESTCCRFSAMPSPPPPHTQIQTRRQTHKYTQPASQKASQPRTNTHTHTPTQHTNTQSHIQTHYHTQTQKHTHTHIGRDKSLYTVM